MGGFFGAAMAGFATTGLSDAAALGKDVTAFQAVRRGGGAAEQQLAFS